DNQRLSLDDGSWSARSQLPLPARARHAAGSVLGNGYSIGGQSGSGVHLDDTDQYTPRDDAWQAKAPLPSPAREQLAAAAISNRIHGYGGALITSVEGSPFL